MARFHTVARVGEVPPGTNKVVSVSGRKIALFNVGGTFHAIDNTCPHQGGPLGEGFLQGTIVTCPYHFWQFDVTNGSAPEFPEARVEQFEIQVEGDEIKVSETPVGEELTGDLPAAPLQPGAKAPDVALPDLEGRTRQLLKIAAASRSGALLVFSKDECPTSRFTLPFLQRIHEALAARGARIVGISQDEPSRAARFVSELGISFPILIDAPPHIASKRYGVMAVPTCFLVARDGAILRSFVGFSRKEIEATAKDLAERCGAAVPAVFHEGEQVPETRPG